MATTSLKVDFSTKDMLKTTIINAGQTIIRLIQSDLLQEKGLITLNIVDENNISLAESHLPSTGSQHDLFEEITSITPSWGSELILMLNMLELGLEDLASDLGWEIMKYARKVQKHWRLWTKDEYLFGCDLLYALATECPSWSHIFTLYLQPQWEYSKISYALKLLKSMGQKNEWDENLLRAYVQCSSQDARKVLATVDGSLKEFLSDHRNLYRAKMIMKSEFKKEYRYDIFMKSDRDRIKQYFDDAGFLISERDLNDVIEPLEKKVTPAEVKAYTISKKTSQKMIYLDFLLSTYENSKIKIKVEHPERKTEVNNLDHTSVHLDPNLAEKLKFKPNQTLWQLEGKDGNQYKIAFPVHETGTYVITVLHKGKPLIKEHLAVNEAVTSKVKVLEKGTRLDDTYIEFEPGSTHPFGLKIQVLSGKVKGEIRHPMMKIDTPLKVFERDVTHITYNNEGIYNFVFEPENTLNFTGGKFEFVLFNDDKSEVLHKELFEIE